MYYYIYSFIQIHCKGDSGGAAIWKDPKDQNRAYVLGIASSFVKCDGIHPSIFSAISGKVAVWVYEKIKSTIECQEQYKSLKTLKHQIMNGTTFKN